MKLKTPLIILGINLILFALLFVLISFNKEVLRPHTTAGSFGNLLVGSFPNFIAAYLISLAPVNAVLIRKPKKARLIVYFSACIIFLILTLEEIHPLWGASTHYDIYDVLASFIGSFCAVLTFELIKRYFKKSIMT